MKKVLIATIACLATISLLAAPASAATKTTITWKVTSLRAGATAKLSSLASSNSPGKKKWTRKGNCTLSASTIKMGSGPCTLTLSIAKSGKYPARTANRTITIEAPIAGATQTLTPLTNPPSTIKISTSTVALNAYMPAITTSTSVAPSSTATTPSSTTTTSTTTTTTTTTVPIVLRTIGTSYRGDDNLTVTLNSFIKTETDGSYRYTFNYTLKNENTDTEISEGTWKIFKNGGGGTPQYGSFTNLFYNGTRTRTYTFEVLKNVNYLYIAYHSDVFFQDTPPGNALVFALP